MRRQPNYNERKHSGYHAGQTVLRPVAKDVCRLLACLKEQPVNYAGETVVVEEGCPVKNSGFSWQEKENHTKQIPRAIPLQSHF